MPLYTYSNPITGKTVEVYQGMTENHEYFENGIKFDRVFVAPNASIDTKIDPFDRKQFIEKTSNKRGTMGDLYDRSAELSEARAQKIGSKDPVKEKFFEDYKAKRGIDHQARKEEKTKQLAAAAGIKIEFNKKKKR